MPSTVFDEPLFLIGVTPGTPAAVRGVRSVAEALARFIAAAQRSLHISIYDFQLADAQAREAVCGALRAAAANGKDVLIAFDHTKTGALAMKGGAENDPALRGTREFIAANLPAGPHLETRPITGSRLMHDKYIVRDEGTDAAAVWTGSANFTDGAWSLQENNVLMIHSRELADRYEEDFQDLWKSGDIRSTGSNDYGELTLGGASVEYAFCPGEGSAAASLFVDAVQGAAGGAVMLASMVISSGPILGALSDHLDRGGSVTGVYDATQMEGVEREWKKSGSAKLPLWKRIQPLLMGKHSTPFSPESPHDFMHNKVLVTDHAVVTGSFNLSQSAESNAENVLSIHEAALIRKYKEYVSKLITIAGRDWK